LGTKNDARYNLKIVDNGTGAAYSSDDNGGSASVSKPQNDDLDEDDAEVSAHRQPESDVVAKTRKELNDLDDLDI
jgi:hypothetical protein